MIALTVNHTMIAWMKVKNRNEMSILKAETTRSNYKLVGVTLPLRVHSYISLYTLAKGSTKAGLFKELIMTWMNEKKETESDKKLIQQITKRIQKNWASLSEKKPDYKLIVFKTDMEQELLSRGIPPNYIELIIKEIV